MGEWQPIPLASKLGATRSAAASLESLVNLYASPTPDGSPHPFTLHGVPGLKLWQTLASGPIRGAHYLPPYLYVVSGNTLYAVDSQKVAAEIGEIKGSGAVYMTANRTHVAIATEVHAYAANVDAGVIELPEQYLCGATYQDGYGIFPQRGTEKFWVTDVDDMTTISGLSFSSADRFADNLVTCRSYNGELWNFGERSIEVWQLVAATFPFSRSAGGSMDVGLGAEGSVAGTQDAMFWFGSDGMVYQAAQYAPRPISPPWVVHEISKASSPTTARAFAYQLDGHTFYELSFPDLTLSYNMTTGLWHKLASYGLGRRRTSCYAKAFGKHIVGDYINGKLYELDTETYDEDGEPLVSQATFPPLELPGSNRATMAELRLNMQTGVGIANGQGSAPRAMLEWTDNNGRTWSNQLEADIGAIGEDEVGATWGRLGAFRRRTLRVSISDPVKREIVGADAIMEAL